MIASFYQSLNLSFLSSSSTFFFVKLVNSDCHGEQQYPRSRSTCLFVSLEASTRRRQLPLCPSYHKSYHKPPTLLKSTHRQFKQLSAFEAIPHNVFGNCCSLPFSARSCRSKRRKSGNANPMGDIDMGRLRTEGPDDDAPFRFNLTCRSPTPKKTKNTPSSCQPRSESGRLALGHVIYAPSVAHEHLTARLLRLLVWIIG